MRTSRTRRVIALAARKGIGTQESLIGRLELRLEMFALSLGCATADAPGLAAFNVSCWRAEPNAPTRPVGGSNETQKVVAFVPPRSDRTDTSFHQSDVRTFSGGGFASELKPKDIPAKALSSSPDRKSIRL